MSILDENTTIIKTEDFFKGAWECPEIKKIEKKLVKYFNSNEYVIGSYIRANKNYSLMNEVVGAEN